MDSEEVVEKQRHGRPGLILTLAIVVLLATICLYELGGTLPPLPKLAFLGAEFERPMNRCSLPKGGIWTNWYVGHPETVDSLLKAARPELKALGYREEPTGKPWISFRKGGETVTICATGASDAFIAEILGLPKPVGSPSPFDRHPEVFILQPGGSEAGVRAWRNRNVLAGWKRAITRS